MGHSDTKERILLIESCCQQKLLKQKLEGTYTTKSRFLGRNQEVEEGEGEGDDIDRKWPRGTLLQTDRLTVGGKEAGRVDEGIAK